MGWCWWWVVQCCRVVLAARGVLRRRCARFVGDPRGCGGYCQQVCGGNYRNWANAIVRGIDVGPGARFVCCCGSVRVYSERVSVCSFNSLMCVQRTYDCSHDGAAELSRSYQCTEQTSVHGARPSFPMRIRAGAFEHSMGRTTGVVRTRACGARACGEVLGRGAARACGARGATGGKPFYPPEVFGSSSTSRHAR